MSVSIPTYCSREEVKQALDVAETARSNERVDRAIESATLAVDGACTRTFVPSVGTRYFPWPHDNYRTPWRLWLGQDELISVTSMTAGGDTIASTGYYLEPINQGPPYTSVEINLGSDYTFQSGDSYQRSIAITGTFGYDATETSVGSLSGNLAATAGATATITWTTSRVGVGDLLHIDSERMVVSDKTMVSSGQTLQTSLTASTSNVAVVVTDGSGFAVGETLLLDSERMLIVDISGTTLTVKRAWDGTVLAAHTSGITIYGLTGVTLLRAQCGSTIAAHTSSTTIYRQVYPSQVRDLAVAYALTQLLQETSGYARVAGSGDNQREVSGRGLKALETNVIENYGRQLRLRSV